MEADLSDQCVLVKRVPVDWNSDQVASRISSVAGVQVRAVAQGAAGSSDSDWVALLFSTEDQRKCVSLGAKYDYDLIMSNPDPSAIPSRNKWILVDEEVVSGIGPTTIPEHAAGRKKAPVPPPPPPKPHRPSANPGTTNIPGPPSEYENTTPYLTDTQPKRILKPPPPVPVRTAQSGSIADEETIPKAVQAKYPPLRDSAEIGSDSTDTDSDPYDDLLCSSEEESSDHGGAGDLGERSHRRKTEKVYETYVRKDPNDSQIYTPLEAGTSHIYVEIISDTYESIAIAGEECAHRGDAMAPYEIVTIDKDAKKRVRIAGSVPDGGDGSHGDGDAGSRAAKPPSVPPRRSIRPADVARDTSAPASRTIEVNGDPATLTSEICWLYFENQRSGGGAVEEVRVAGEGRVFVTFALAEVAQRVAAGSHKIHGKPVEVKLSVPPRPGQRTQSKVPSVPRYPQPSPAAGHRLMAAPSEQPPVQNPPVKSASKGQKNATEISLKVEPLQLRLMHAAYFKETAENRHPGVTVEMDESNQQIVFRGPGQIARKAQSDARRLLRSAMSGKATQLTDTQKTVLGTTQGAHYVAESLKSCGVVAVWDTGPQGDIVIHAFSENDLRGAAVLIHHAIVENQRELPPQSRPVLQSTEWMEHIKSLYDKHPGTLIVLPSQDGRLVCVTGTHDILNSAATEVFKFIHTNTLHSETFRFSPSRQRFVTLFWPNKLADIQNSLKQHKVQITIDDDDDGSKLCVLGQSEGLVIARTRLEGLGEKILCHEERLTDRHQLKFLYSKNCRKHLDSLGKGCRCVISLEPESPGLLCDGDKTGQNVCNIDSSSSAPAEAGTSSLKPPPRATTSGSPKTAAAGQVPPVPAKASASDRQSNIKLVIEQGEIAGVRADVIVNTTSTDLDLAKGAVSSSILKAGGSSLQEECQHKYPVGIKPGEIAHTKGHGLACKEVYHIALEAWSSGAEKTLSAVILECLERASRNRYKTIAFPALGTGGLGYPREKVARSMFMVLSQFQKDKPTSSLREVRVVLHESDRQSIQVFRQQEGQFSQDVSVQVITTSSSTQKPNTAEIKISITEGEIAREKVGVIVNSTSPELDLGRGSVSASILKVGGSSLQEECRQKYPSGIKAGEIAHTRGHGLACKEVYHLALTTWSSAASQTLSTVLFECLERASKNLYTSIAFPALGTGKLGYPCENVARTMFAVVAQFRQAMPTSPLREVRIVLYPNDRSAIKAFRAIDSQSRSESVAATPESKDTSKEATLVSKEVGRQRTVSETSTSDRENAPPQRRVSFPAPEVTFEFRGLVLKILQGDITKEDVDLLVIRTNSHLALTVDTAAGVLKNKYGPEWEQDLRKKVPELQKTGVTMAFTGGGMVLFVDSFRFSADLKKAYKSCLEKADSVCVKSVAIPPLGTRGLAGSDQKVAKAAKVFIKTLTKFCSDKQRSVKELRVVTGDLTLLRTFADVVRTKLEKKGIKFTCQENLAVAAHEDPSSPPLQQHDSLALKEASLFVFADDPRNIETAVNEFRELVKDRFIEKTMSDDKVMSLNDEQVARIRRAGKQNDVDVNVNRSAGCLTLRGDHSDVIDTIEEINGIFMAAHVEQQEEKAARTIAQIVQWYFLKGDTAAASQRKEYGLRENRVIEEAFQRRDKCVKFADANGVNCVIDFDAMKQYPEDDPTDVVSVIRRVKITDARHSASTRRPRKWTSKSTLEPVDVVELHPTESEYKDVHRNFLATLGNLDVKINSIKRIENTMLYEQYEAKKFHLERQNPGIENEKSLWHGTSADAITNINRYGFNRSYCGKNATRYGQGVYFAVKSVISTNPSFSPADVTGKRYIYQCKVLVGHSVKGTSDMRFLPKREGETLYDSACNDPDDPDTYLIFNDTQAYPEYLVTFTEQKSPASL